MVAPAHCLIRMLLWGHHVWKVYSQWDVRTGQILWKKLLGPATLKSVVLLSQELEISTISTVSQHSVSHYMIVWAWRESHARVLDLEHVSMSIRHQQASGPRTAQETTADTACPSIRRAVEAQLAPSMTSKDTDRCKVFIFCFILDLDTYCNFSNLVNPSRMWAVVAKSFVRFLQIEILTFEGFCQLMTGWFKHQESWE